VRSVGRLSREALGLAGSAADPVRVWVLDWSLAAQGQGLRLQAGDGGLRLDLALEPLKPALGGAELGLLPQGPAGGGLRLYVLPRLLATGRLVREGETVELKGTALLDHAWGSPLGLGGGLGAALGSGSGLGSGGEVGLDRFVVQLDDSSELICVQIRRRDGSGTPVPACALVESDGRVQALGRREIELAPTERWRSPRTGRRWPIGWRLASPPLGLDLSLEPLAADQEPQGPLPLWSGAVRARGQRLGQPVSGRGRVDLTIPDP
jgi:predicted secreted hydrolase